MKMLLFRTFDQQLDVERKTLTLAQNKTQKTKHKLGPLGTQTFFSPNVSYNNIFYEFKMAT